jgi:hypothetical protein
MINQNLAINEVQNNLEEFDECVRQFNEAPNGEDKLEMNSVIFTMHTVIMQQAEEIKKLKEAVFALVEKTKNL